jgi:hypothetical protein
MQALGDVIQILARFDESVGGFGSFLALDLFA